MSGQINHVVSCVECQRRKQRVGSETAVDLANRVCLTWTQCNRQFPCNHCTKRGVAHLCRFIPKTSTARANKSDSSVVDDSSR